MSAPTNNPTWYVASLDGKQEGPMNFSAVQDRLRNGTLRPTQLVWREGMADSTPAGQVPELKAAGATTTAPQAAIPPVTPPPAAAVPNPYSSAAGTSGPKLPTPVQVEKVLSEMASPTFFRNLGRGCGAAGVVIFVGSMMLFFFGYAWFTGGLILCLMWMVGEGIAAVLQSLERLGTMVSTHPSTGSSSAHKT